MMRITKKLASMLMAVTLLALSLPPGVALAADTTVAINNGSTLILNAGQNITSSSTTGIPIDVKGLIVSANATGLAAFDFTLNWNPAVIRVDAVRRSLAASDLGWGFTTGAINNTTGTVNFVGTTVGEPPGTYSSADLTIAYLGLGAVGNPGDTTSINITITNLTDNERLEITPRNAVNAPVEINLGTLQTIAVTPTAPSIALGLTQQFTATGNYSSGATQNLTGTANWTSSSPSVATIGLNTGLATSVGTGTTTITARWGSISGNTTLTVTAPVLLSIAVTPVNPSIALGLTKQFTATGNYTNNTTANITGSANWTSSNTGVATIGLNTGQATSVAQGTTNITATWGSISDNTTLTVTAPVLLSIAVTPANQTIALGLTQQFNATGTYTNGSQNITGSVGWTSSNTSVATINSAGLATSVWAGTTVITANLSAINGNTNLTVTIATSVQVNNGNMIGLDVGANVTSSSTTGIPIDVKGLIVSANATGLAAFDFTLNWNPAVIRVDAVRRSLAASDLGWGFTTGAINNTTGTVNFVGTTVGEPPGTYSSADLTLAYLGLGAVGQMGDNTTLTVTITNLTDNERLEIPALPVNAVVQISLGALNSIAVTPVNSSVAAGRTQQFTATGNFTLGLANITGTANWTSTNPSVATIGLNTGLATAVAIGTTTIRATSGNISGSTTLTVTAAELVSIAVTPANPSVAAGRTKQFNATGNYTNNTTANLTGTATWSSSNTTVATISTAGLATSRVIGTTTIRATSGNISGNTTLTVTAAELVSIAVTPVNPSVAAGRTQQFNATGTYTDGSTDNHTGIANWTSANTTVATIGLNTGLATSLVVGTTVITATCPTANISGNTTLTVTAAELVSIAVTPANPTIALGLTKQFSANGTYTDANTANITGTVTWTSANTSVATINSATGLATSVATGNTTITATKGTISGNTTLTVTAPELLSIAVTPSFASIPLGLTQQFNATGNYTNGTANITGSANWTSSNTSVATIGLNTGLATSVNKNQGTTLITATWGTVTSRGVTLLVTAPNLLSLTVSPTTANVTAGATRQFTATGNFTDNPSRDITNTATWTSSDSSVASIQTTGQANPGLAKGFKTGTVTITATQGGKSVTATLTVTEATVFSIAIVPLNPTITVNSTQQFRAIAIKTDGSKVEVTTSANWSSNDTAVATIRTAGQTNPGLATANATGTANITAAYGGQSGSTTLNVIAVPLVSIAVTPAGQSVAAGKTQQFIATGNYSDGLVDTLVNLTASANWTSSNTSVARIRAGGLAISYAVGNTTITATFGTISGNTTLEVTAAVLDAVTVTPVSPSITFVSGAPPTLQFKATAILSDGSANTTAANWTSSAAPGVATIDANGLATTVDSGNTTITANVSIGGISKVDTTLITVLADKVAPAVRLTSPSDGLVISSTNLMVTGSVNDVNAVTTLILNDGAPVALPLVGGNFSRDVVLTAGTNTIQVKAVDVAVPGNTGSAVARVVVDPRKPSIVITSPAEGLVTNNSTLTVSYNITGATSATLRVNGVAVATVSGNSSTNVTLARGKNTIMVSGYATGESTAPFLGTSGARTVTLDTTLPVVALISPASGSVVNTPGITVRGTIDDWAISTANLTLNGVSQLIPVVGGNFSQDLKLAAGNNTITAWATDRAGNNSLVASTTVTFDNTKPEVTITTPTNNQLTNVGGQLVTGNVSDPSITTATLLVNNASQTISVSPDGSFSQIVALTAGANTIEARATDAASNTGTSGIINVTLDAAPPVLIIGLSDPTDSILITVTANETLTAIPTVNVNPAITMTPVAVNQWTGVFEPIPAGSYTVTATGTDLAGNPTQTTATFTKQTVDIIAGNATSIQAGNTLLQVTTNTTQVGEAISVTQYNENPAENTASGTGAGIFLEIVASGNLTNSITSIELRVPYDEAAIIARGIAEATLQLYVLSATTGLWEPVPGIGSPPQTVDTVLNYLLGLLPHLSKYGGFGTAQAGGGGGGGGGGGIPTPTITTVSTPGLSSVPLLKVNKNGIVQSDAVLITTDQKVYLNIAKDTKMLDAQGKALVSLSAAVVTAPAAAPAGKAILYAYNFGPNEATFTPAITLTMTYTEPLPNGMLESGLYIAYWDGTKWVALTSTVDTTANTVTAATGHFTQFALIGTVPPVVAPAAFTTSALSISPAEVKIGEVVTVTVLVANTGGLSGTYKVTLKINDVVVETKDVTLNGGASQTVSFTTSKDVAGTYTVAIDALSGTFTVKVPPVVAAPAAFTTSALSISPAEVKVGEVVTISVLVSNTGELSGRYAVTLKLNNVVVETKDVTLNGGASQTVTFTTSQDVAGTYTVAIDALSGSFTVTAPSRWWVWLIVGLVVVAVIAGVVWWVRRRTA